MPEDIELPVDPEDGLTPAAVRALHGFVLADDPNLSHLDLVAVVEAWLEWCEDEELTADALVAVDVVQEDDGSLEVRRAGRRPPRGSVVLRRLDADLQRTLLETPASGSAEVRMAVATASAADLVSELAQVDADPEKLYGHLALVHGLDPRDGDDRARRMRHREAHRLRDGWAGHHEVAPPTA